jgi:hypothetical protein
MRFDVIVGNPPYQMDSAGQNRTMPLYNLFVEHAIALNPRYISMIILSRWMAGGIGLSDFRSQMVADKRIRELVDYPDSRELFHDGVRVMGGACYFLWDRDHPGLCRTTLVRGGQASPPIERRLIEYDILVRDTRALGIFEKVQSHSEASLFDIMSSDKEFGLTSNFSGYQLEQFPSVTRPSATSCRRVRCVDFRRHSAGAGRAAHLGRRLLRSGFRARQPARGGLAGHHSAAVPAAVGQRRDRTADGPGPVRPSVPRRRRCAAICAGTPAPIVREPPDRTTGTCEAQHRRHRVPQRRPRRPTAGVVVLPVPAAPGSWPSTGR